MCITNWTHDVPRDKPLYHGKLFISKPVTYSKPSAFVCRSVRLYYCVSYCESVCLSVYWYIHNISATKLADRLHMVKICNFAQVIQGKA